MPLRYLLDTNTASYIIRDDTPSVRRRLVKTPVNQLAISAVTESELRYGVARRRDASTLRAIVSEFLLRMTILPWDSMAAECYGELRATLEREGQPMGNLDLMIAAQALATDLILVSNDQAFRRVKGLTVENWAH